ncbi:MAG: glycosyltransferase family 2 protein [Flavobacteriales bacterium]|nr:glycosyltransferase family 2 protein [Flavobacteriales bacterium]
MEKITAIIPCFNEEQTLEAAIESVKFADELLVVDSFSTDASLDIARKHGARIIQREYENSASQKNWAIPQASHEWIVLLDADEVVPMALRAEVEATVASDPLEVAFWIPRRNKFMGRWIRYSGWQGDRVIRLFRKSKCRYENKHVHAEVLADGPVGQLKNSIDHDTYLGLNAYVRKLNRYADWQARDYHPKTGRIGFYHLWCKPAFRFFKHYWLKGGFRDAVPGLAISYLQAYAVRMRYLKMWDLRRTGKL